MRPLMSSLLSGLLIISVGCISSANALWDVRRNPDRFVSIGFNLGAMQSIGSYDMLQTSFTDKIYSNTGEYKQDMYAVGFDVRIPANSYTTVTIGYDSISGSQSFESQKNPTIVTRSSQFINSSGYAAHLNLRLYLNK